MDEHLAFEPPPFMCGQRVSVLYQNSRHPGVIVAIAAKGAYHSPIREYVYQVELDRSSTRLTAYAQHLEQAGFYAEPEPAPNPVLAPLGTREPLREPSSPSPEGISEATAREIEQETEDGREGNQVGDSDPEAGDPGDRAGSEVPF